MDGGQSGALGHHPKQEPAKCPGGKGYWWWLRTVIQIWGQWGAGVGNKVLMAPAQWGSILGLSNSTTNRKKAREFLKDICYIDYAKFFDCVDYHKLWKILQEMGITDHLIWLGNSRPPYLTPEKPLCRSRRKNLHQATDWFKIGKGVHQGCMMSPCLFNLYAEYIMKNARLDEAQAGIKIARRNINNLRYADDTTLTAEAKKNRRASWWKWNRRVKKLT